MMNWQKEESEMALKSLPEHLTWNSSHFALISTFILAPPSHYKLTLEGTSSEIFSSRAKKVAVSLEKIKERNEMIKWEKRSAIVMASKTVKMRERDETKKKQRK
jgi:hypothetical protein